jgi:DNA-binding CsgD family transcriptional regulator
VNSADPVQRLLGSVYAAPIRPELWCVVLEQLSDMTGVTKAALITHDITNSEHRMLAILGDSVKEGTSIYERSYFQHDEWTLRFPKRGFTGRVIRGEEIWPEHAFYKSTFFNEFLQKFDVCQMACLASGGTPGIFEALSIYRGPRDHEFGPEVLAILEMLAPHLQTSLHMRRIFAALESRVSDLENALDLVSTGLVLLDAKGNCVLVNKTAKAILDQRDGLFLERKALAASDLSESTTLRKLINSAILPCHIASHKSNKAMKISRRNAKHLQILTAPLRRENVAGSNGAVGIVFISDPEQNASVSSEILQVLFGLTPAEARLAIALLEGKSILQTAVRHNVSRETVRSQIKSLFQKTGTKRQGELVRLLAGVSHPKQEG